MQSRKRNNFEFITGCKSSLSAKSCISVALQKLCKKMMTRNRRLNEGAAYEAYNKDLMTIFNVYETMWAVVINNEELVSMSNVRNPFNQSTFVWTSQHQQCHYYSLALTGCWSDANNILFTALRVWSSRPAGRPAGSFGWVVRLSRTTHRWSRTFIVTQLVEVKL